MQHNKKIYFVLCVVVLLIAIVLCLSAQKKASSTTYRVGVMVPLTGPSASFGERVRNGVMLALQDISKDGKTPAISPVFEDDKGDAATAVTVAHKLIDVDGLHVIIGTVKSDAMLAVAPITEKDKVILFSPTAGAASITQAGDFVFRNIETPAIHGNTDASFFSDHKVGKAAVFIANASNAQGYGNAFTQSFGSRGTIVSTTTYNQSDTDFHTMLAKALSFRPDGIYIGVATAKDGGLLAKQIRELGFKGLIMESVAADAKEFFDTAGPSAEGVYVSTSYFDPSTEPSQSYNEEFRSTYGASSDAFAANAYDATMLLYAAMQKCGGDDKTECIRDYLYATKNYAGVSGATSFDVNGDVMKLVEIKRAEGGMFVQVK